MEGKKKDTAIEFIKKIGDKCVSCGKYFIGASIEAFTEDGNYGIDFGEITDYYINCGKCPECAKECYNNFHEYVDTCGKSPCNDEEIEIDDFKEYKDYIACYPYTNEFQNEALQYGSGHIKAGCLIDLSDIILHKFRNINKKDIDDLDF